MGYTLSEVPGSVFDDLGGRFEARIRDHRIVTHSSRVREGEITLTSSLAIIEVRFDFDVLDRLHDPAFIAIERNTSKGVTYVIYEVAALRPTHFQQLGMDVSMPTVIRKEYLDTISGSWGDSEETWIDVAAVPTQYRMDYVDDQLIFNKARLIPLTGSKVLLLSRDAVKSFLCVEDGVEIGELMGFDMPLTVSIDNMVRYHTGIFGFTGSGKSNLTSFLVRRALQTISDLKFVIFDVSGEYSIHLIDLLLKRGLIFSTEDFDGSSENFLNSQAIPESLEEKVGGEALTRAIEKVFEEDRVQNISLSMPEEMPKITLGYLISMLEGVSEQKGSGGVQATLAVQKLVQYFFDERAYDLELDLSSLKGEDRRRLVEILDDLVQSVHGMSALRLDLTSLINHINTMAPEEEEFEGVSILSPERLAAQILRGDSERLNIVYLPNPDEARLAVSRFLEHLLFLKKTSAGRRKVLIVLDEAQEFIPDRTLKADFTDRSNKAVEALLRQGRKYRAHCWLSTQRVAHINVNALQQIHSYFVSTLPRFYDRMVIADAFSLSYDLLERTTELDTGEWLFVSYKATKQKNVPTFIKAPDNEEVILKNLKSF